MRRHIAADSRDRDRDRDRDHWSPPVVVSVVLLQIQVTVTSHARQIGLETMIRHEAERLAIAVHALRPDWPAASLTTILANHQHQTYLDVALALTALALDPATRTPGRLAEDGPWWRLGITATNAPPGPPAPRVTCRECGLSHAGHDQQNDLAAQLGDPAHDWQP